MTVAAPAQAVDRQATAKIINGALVSGPNFTARWQFISALVTATQADEYAGQFCGASLIDPSLVVTAAHCVTDVDNGDLIFSAPTSIDVVSGRVVLNNDGSGERLDVAAIYVHPNHDPDSLRNDIAVIRLATPAAATPIDLVGAGDTALWGAGSGLAVSSPNGPWVAGWGNLSILGTNYPNNLYEAEVPIKSDATCGNDNAGGLSEDFVVASMLCAGILDTNPNSNSSNGVDTCQGDSGGPLIVDDPMGGFKLAGITSWGLSCAGDSYGFYSRIDGLRTWVESIPSGAGGANGLLDPTALSVASTGVTTTTLTWAAPGGGPVPTLYNVYVQDSDWQYPIGTTASTILGIGRLDPASTYTFVVKSVDANGSESGGVEVVMNTLPDTVRPTRPRLVHMHDRTQTTIRIAWNRSRDNVRVVRYRLYRRDPSGWHVACVVSRLTHSCKVGNLKPHRRYHWKVRAVDSSGNYSAASVDRVIATL